MSMKMGSGGEGGMPYKIVIPWPTTENSLRPNRSAVDFLWARGGTYEERRKKKEKERKIERRKKEKEKHSAEKAKYSAEKNYRSQITISISTHAHTLLPREPHPLKMKKKFDKHKLIVLLNYLLSVSERKTRAYTRRTGHKSL